MTLRAALLGAAVVCLASAGAGSVCVAAAGVDPARGLGLALVGQAGGAVQAVAVAGSHAYIGMGPRLVVVDVANPDNPVVVGASAPLPGLVTAVAAFGTIVYVGYSDATRLDPVAGTWGALRVLDVSRPGAPVELGTYVPSARGTPAPIAGLAVVEERLYVAAGGAGLRIVDVTNPRRPHEVGAVWLGWARALAVQGDLAYVGTADRGLATVDVSQADRPELVSTVLLGQVSAVAAGTDLLYVADSAGGIWFLDIRNPREPEVTQSISTSGPAALAVDGRLFILAATNRVVVMDLSIDTGFGRGILGLTVVPGFALDVAVAGSRAYLAMGTGGLRIVDFAEPEAPIEVGAVVGPFAPAATAFVGGHVLLADPATGVQVLALDDPTWPRKVAAYPALGAVDVAVDGEVAYVATSGNGLRLVDVSAPSRPREVAAVLTDRSVVAVAVLRDTAYVSHLNDLAVVDVSRPDAPVVVDFRDIGRHPPPPAMVIRPPYLYSASAGGLRVHDISAPRAPSDLGGWPWKLEKDGTGIDLAVEEGLAVLAFGEHGLRVIDVREPGNPVEVGAYDPDGRAVAVALAGRRAFLAVEGDEDVPPRLVAVDLTDPSLPRTLASWSAPVWPVVSTPHAVELGLEGLDPDVAVDGGLVYFSAPFLGVYVLRTFEGPRVFLPSASR